MKFSYATIFAVAASLTSAYTTSDIPNCAIPCFESGAPQVGCTVTDQKCQCAKASELTDKMTGCVTDACSIEDALKTQQVSTGLCEQLSSSASSAAATATGSSVPSSSGFFVTTSKSTTSSAAPASSNGTALVTATTTDSSTSSSATTASATVTESADGDSFSSSASGTASATGSASTANGGNMVGFREGLGVAVAIGMGWYFHF